MCSGVWEPTPSGRSSAWEILRRYRLAQQSAGAKSQSEEDGLLEPLQLVDGVITTADIQPALPLGAVSIVNDGLTRSGGG